MFGFSISCFGKIPWTPLAYLLSLINLAMRANSYGLPSSNLEAKLQLLSMKESYKSFLIIIKLGFWLFYAKIFTCLGLRVGSSFLLYPTLDTSHKPHVREIVAMSYLGLRTPSEVVSPNFRALNSRDCMEQVTWDLWVGTHVNQPWIYILDVLTLLLWDKARNAYESMLLFYFILEDFSITKLHYGFTFPILRWVHVKLQPIVKVSPTTSELGTFGEYKGGPCGTHCIDEETYKKKRCPSFYNTFLLNMPNEPKFVR